MGRLRDRKSLKYKKNMASTSKKDTSLLPQESRTSRSRRGGTIVPDPSVSLSCDGPSDDCTARSSEEAVIAKTIEVEKPGGFVKPGPTSYKKRKKGEMERFSGDSEMEAEAGTETITVVSSEEDYVGGSDSGETTYSEGGTKRKRGRPPTTGEYAGRAEAQKKLADQEARLLLIQQEKEWRDLTTEEFYNKCGLDLEEAIETMRRNPTADLSNRARELQREVLRVAKVSTNINGLLKKHLKDAAVLTAACVEVLRTRVVDGPDTDAGVQLREMGKRIETLNKEKEEARERVLILERALQEKGEALERIDKLEKALLERKSPGKDRVLRSAGIGKKYLNTSEEEEDDRPSKKKVRVKSSSASPKNKMAMEIPRYAEESMEEEIGDSMAPSSSAPPSDTGMETLSSRKGGLPVMGAPPIRGRPRILDERVLMGQDRIFPGKGKSPSVPKKGAEREKAVSAIGLFEQLVPMLNKWIESKLGALFPLTHKAPQVQEGSLELRGSVNQASPVIEVDISNELMLGGVHSLGMKAEEEGLGSGRELYSQVLGRRQGTAVKKQQKRERKRTKTISTGSEARSGREKVGPTSKGTPRSKPKKREMGRIAPPSGGKRTGSSRPPNSAAVTLTCPEGCYSEAITKAKESINLKELGISSLHPRRAITGALVLEIKDPEGASKARLLKERMQESLAGMEGVRVARPVKSVDLRIRDIPESIAEEAIKRTISQVGGCPEDEVRVGVMQRSLNGLFSIWVRCPVATANKLVRGGTMQVDWFTTRVEALATRPLSCFRCLELGHVQASCKSLVDRRGLCYRCGQPGHLARNCESRPHCPVCAQAGRPSAHRVGVGCPTTGGGRGRKTTGGGGPQLAAGAAVTPPSKKAGGPVPSSMSSAGSKDDPTQKKEAPSASGKDSASAPMEVDARSPELRIETPKEQRTPRVLGAKKKGGGKEKPMGDPVPSTSKG